jgi:predicted  nucleic acid-binding Zn-ribbon protein
MSPLEQLLVVQTHDTAAEGLRHRRATLPEREVLATAEAGVTALEPQLADARGRRDEVAREVKRLDDESAAVTARIKDVEKTMYSGTISSPRELQAMQADVESLGRHNRTLDDRELELMERQETLDAEVGGIEVRVSELRAVADNARGALVEKESAIDAELADELAARGAAAGAIPADLLATYERIRLSNHGAGVARLIGNTCQGCRLTIPATEVDQIHRQGADGTVFNCDNCGAILVPTS